MPNYIRVKQIDQPELTGFFVDSISSQSGLLINIASGVVSNQAVSLTGDQTISGLKNFSFRPNVNGTGILLSGEAGSMLLPTTVLYTSGNQIKSGRLIIGDSQDGVVDPNSNYTLSVQSNNTDTWLEILNNGGADKGVFYGIKNNDFEQYNWQGGDILFFTSTDASDGYERLRITKDGKVGIGTNSPSQKLEVNGNIKASGASFVENTIVGDPTQDDFLVVSGNNFTLYGSGTFTNGIFAGGNSVFDTIKIKNKILSSYNYTTSNFTFNDNYINLINAPNNVTGTLPSEIISGINYYVKNLNTGRLTITGDANKSIDGFSTVNLYQNESLQLLGVNSVGYTGWVTISSDVGVS